MTGVCEEIGLWFGHFSQVDISLPRKYVSKKNVFEVLQSMLSDIGSGPKWANAKLELMSVQSLTDSSGLILITLMSIMTLRDPAQDGCCYYKMRDQLDIESWVAYKIVYPWIPWPERFQPCTVCYEALELLLQGFVNRLEAC